MNLLVFSPYYPPHTGGLESHSDEFNKYLSQRGVSITVFTPRLPEYAPEIETRYERVRIIRFPAFELFPNYPLPRFWEKTFWKQWGLLARGDFHICLSRTRFFFTSLMAWRYVQKYHMPWVHIEHGSDFAQFHSSIKTILGKIYDFTVGAFILRQSNLVIANSLASADFVKRLSGQSDCAVIYRGVEHALIEKVTTNLLRHEQYRDKVIIGYIGRLIDGKGVADLLQALTLLKRDDFVCLIVGDGPERGRLENIILRSNLSEKVILLGQKDFTETIRHLKLFDIFVNPSYTEGIPTAVIEAALCAKAIIATDVGGTREIISGKTDGILIPAGNIPVLVEQLTLLLENQVLRLSLGKEAFKIVQEKFDWNQAAGQYQILLQKLLDQKK